jgi:hypothetical protein
LSHFYREYVGYLWARSNPSQLHPVRAALGHENHRKNSENEKTRTTLPQTTNHAQKSTSFFDAERKSERERERERQDPEMKISGLYEYPGIPVAPSRLSACLPPDQRIQRDF